MKDLAEQLQEMAARGAVKVHEQLALMQKEGKIDVQGNLLVPVPADMLPGSETDV